jgi:hypothetical protein
MKMIGLVAYRCRECNRRFYVTLHIHEKLRRAREREEQREEERLAAVAEQAEARPVS